MNESTLRLGGTRLLMLVLICFSPIGTRAQQTSAPSSQQSSAAPLTITLQDALVRARTNEPSYTAAVARYGIARQGTTQARAGMLPSVNYNNQFIYTQGNGTASGRFIAANGVHEYLSQGAVHQEFSLQVTAEYRLARAQEALARANAEIAARGLVVTVTQTYYALVVAQRKYATAQRAADEAQHFQDITQKLERGGEVAHSDTLKAQLQAQQQQRALAEAQLDIERARLDLAVILFPGFNENFNTVDDLDNVQPLPSFQEAESQAGQQNPQLAAALASLHEANQEVAVAWGGLLPTLGIDYLYGIDANQFATNGFDPITKQTFRNLGYGAAATLQIPIWNWGANRSKLRSAHIARDQAQVELSFAQRKMVADLKAFYGEAQTARTELESLRQSSDMAAESLRLTNLRYQAGEATALEVVDAQNTLTQAQNSLGDGQVRFRVAVANLQTLTGKF